MQRTIKTTLSMAILFGVIAVSWAALPPPPANQYLGVYDTDFGYLTRVKCLECHTGDQLLVQRHHALLNNVAPAKTYQCLSCHVLIEDSNGGYVLDDFRTCENCHTASPHHITAAASSRQCNVCHGSLVDNYDDGHYIPVYQKSSNTPETYGTVFINSTTGAQTVYRGCGACHQPDLTAIDPATNTQRPILGNKQTHHSTRLSCSLCHNVHGGVKDIRQCETCHGIKSLHNIQKDSPSTVNTGNIVTFEEEPGWGHVGNKSDCYGCHEPMTSASSTSPSTATVPAITGLSSYTVNSGKNTQLTINGASFVNSSIDTTYSPSVVIGAGNNAVTLQPISYSENLIQVAIPPLSPGNYDLRVVKDDKQSNRARITAVPLLSAKAAVIGNNAVITIVGSGFEAQPPEDYTSGLGVFVNNTEASVLSWSDTKIVVSFRNANSGDNVVIKSLNGTVSVLAAKAIKKTR